MQTTFSLSQYLNLLQATRTEVASQYQVSREAYLTGKYGDAAARAAMSDKQKINILAALAEKHPEWVCDDPFAPYSTWRLREATIPLVPLKELCSIQMCKEDGTMASCSAASPATPSSLPDGRRPTRGVLQFSWAEYQLLKAGPTYHEDALLFRYVLARHLDVVSAAARFLTMRAIVLTYGLSFTLDDDIRRALSLGVFGTSSSALQQSAAFCASAPTDSNVLNDAATPTVFVVTPRRLDWNQVTTLQMQKGWFYFFFLIMSLDYNCQLEGVMLCNSLKGIGVANIRIEFQKFLAHAVAKAMPIRIREGFIGNQPALFDWVLWPIMRQILSEKLLSRIHVVGKDYSTPLAAIGPTLLLKEMGGEAEMPDPAVQLDLVEVVSRYALTQ